MRVIGLAGWSGAGKTTLMVRLIPVLCARGLRVATLKHVHHDFAIDQAGKDSYRHREAGATEVLVASPHRFALIHELHGKPEPSLADYLGRFTDADIVLIEGYRQARHVKIEVHRAELAKAFLFPQDSSIEAIVSDAPADVLKLFAKLPRADFAEIEKIADFVERLALPLDQTLLRLNAPDPG
jgi:molybdopterin-guanine dinucleotide biosynthesis protein B